MLRKLLLSLVGLCMVAPGADAAVSLPHAEDTWTSPHELALEEEAGVSLIPFPQQVEWKKGALPRSKGKHPKLYLRPVGDVGEQLRTAERDFAALTKARRKSPDQVMKVRCTLKKDALPADKAAEGYVLTIDADGIRVEAATEAGLVNGYRTVCQMWCTGGDELPYCKITDWPAFAYRGYMHDCGRNFRSVERLKEELTIAAMLKVNVFHWHLTDYPAWHIECKAYPQLNDPRHRTRDKNDTYSYAQIREVMEYAAARNIKVIPELDMPGHSAYFDRAFGFKMHTEQGMKIVGELLDEFCNEIPADLCPIVHFGADEVRIPNAAQFVSFVTEKLQSHGRTPMQWASPRDLPVGDHSIEQRWGEGSDMVAKSIIPERIVRRAIDSTMGYANLLDPAMLVRRYFFMRPCGVGAGDAQKLGSIICIWPDGKVDDKTLIPGMCAMWPGMMAMAERAWKGGTADGDYLPLELSAADAPSSRAYALFEKRMQALRKTGLFRGEAFPVWYESGVDWTVVEPVPAKQAEAVRAQVLAGDMAGLTTRAAHGANLYFRTRPDTGYLGMFSMVKPGHTAWAITNIKAEKAGKQKFMIGFDAPARSNRRWSGIPQKGEWSQCGTRIWLNGKELKNPRAFRLAGQKKHPGNAWNFEQPLDPEEIWWIQDPIEIELKKGDNQFIIEQPYHGEYQSWGVSLIPLP